MVKKYFQILGVISLICFSFFYTEKTVNVVKDTDSLMIEIKEKAANYEQSAVDALIENDTIIPGLYGKTVNISSSYDNMKRLGYFHDSMLIYHHKKPNITLKGNYHYYVIGGNPNKKMVSLMFMVDSNSKVESVLKVLDQYKIKATFFVDGTWFEEHNDMVVSLIEQGHTIGNLSYHGDYRNSGFVWMNTIIQKVGKQTDNYCYNETSNVEQLDICSLQKSYTIRPNIILKNYPMVELKQQLVPGSFISLPITDSVIGQLEVMIQFIQSKGLNITNLSEHLKEMS